MEEVATPILVAQNMRAHDIQTVALLAGHVEGNVRALLTPVAALAMGIGFASTLLLGKMLLPQLFRSARHG